eukprot:m.43737 g.43737  ORF g.43737 m.43737 type:complete len:170 (+) comp10816_c0_seq2:239-748(+)
MAKRYFKNHERPSQSKDEVNDYLYSGKELSGTRTPREVKERLKERDEKLERIELRTAEMRDQGQSLHTGAQALTRKYTSSGGSSSESYSPSRKVTLRDKEKEEKEFSRKATKRREFDEVEEEREPLRRNPTARNPPARREDETTRLVSDIYGSAHVSRPKASRCCCTVS